MDVWYHLQGCDFSWNAAKAIETQRARGIRFEDAATVFFDPLLRIVDASRNDDARDAAIGFDTRARLMFVVHAVLPEECIRIISARMAEPAEEAFYAD
jgi:uncharacterized DUF497 family protein